MDDYHVSFDAGRVAASKAIARRLVERMGPWDQAAVISTSGRSSAQAEFTSDRALLVAAIDKFFPQSEIGARGGIEQRTPAMGGGRFNFVQETKARWAMDALSNAAKTLAFIPHRRKAVLLVSQGLPVSVEEIVTNQNAAGAAQALRDFIVTAQRSNIAVYTMDPCGLDLDEGCNTSSRQNLESLAESTGGFAVTNTNAPERSVDRDGGRERHLLPARLLVADAERRQASPDSRAGESARRGGPGPRQLLRAERPGANDRGPRVGRLADRRADSVARTDACGSRPCPAPLAQKPAATVAVGIEMTAADAIRARTIDFSLVAVGTDGKIRARQRFQSSFSAKSGARQAAHSLRVARGRSARAVSDSSGGRLGAAARSAACSRKCRCRTSARRSRSAAFRSRRRQPPLTNSPSSSPACCRWCRSLPPSSRPARQVVAQLPLRVSSRATGPLTIDATLTRDGAAPQSLEAPAPDVKPFAAAGGSVYTVALPANLGVGTYRLVVEAALGREKATREVRFRVVEG